MWGRTLRSAGGCSGGEKDIIATCLAEQTQDPQSGGVLVIRGIAQKGSWNLP